MITYIAYLRSNLKIFSQFKNTMDISVEMYYLFLIDKCSLFPINTIMSQASLTFKTRHISFLECYYLSILITFIERNMKVKILCTWQNILWQTHNGSLPFIFMQNIFLWHILNISFTLNMLFSSIIQFKTTKVCLLFLEKK